MHIFVSFFVCVLFKPLVCYGKYLRKRRENIITGNIIKSFEILK